MQAAGANIQLNKAAFATFAPRNQDFYTKFKIHIDISIALYYISLISGLEITHLTKTETEPQIRIFNNPSLGFCQNEPQTGIIEMCPQVVGENNHFGRGIGKNLS